MILRDYPYMWRVYEIMSSKYYLVFTYGPPRGKSQYRNFRACLRINCALESELVFPGHNCACLIRSTSIVVLRWQASKNGHTLGRSYCESVAEKARSILTGFQEVSYHFVRMLYLSTLSAIRSRLDPKD